MSSKKANTQTNNQSSSSSNPPATSTEKSTYAIVKDGWGSRPNFQHSYGLDMTPEGIEEGNAILEAMKQSDRKAGKK